MMRMMRLVITTLFLVAAVQAVSEPVTVVGMIQRALANRDDASRILHYLRMSSKDLRDSLPTISTDGKKKNSYTFFAPTTAAFQRTLPQDVADPFFQDAEFRNGMILSHFATQSIASKAELGKLKELKMADAKTAKITHQGDVNMINEGEIKSEAIELDRDLGVVYMVDRVFVTPEQISKIIAKHPGPSLGVLAGGAK